jgi:acetyl-CoA C-acetyltransferase
MVVGAEKVKDTGYQGLNAFGAQRRLWAHYRGGHVLHDRPAYGHKYGVDDDTMRRCCRTSPEEPLQRGNERAQFRKEISVEQVSRPNGRHLGRVRRRVADGAAAAIVCRVEDATATDSRCT